MKLWHKLLIILAAMVMASFGAGRLWLAVFDFVIPSYLAGVVGGMASLVVWEALRRIDKRRS
jgi:hypothetical protein